MEHAYELHLEQVPIYYGNRKMALDNPELTIHKFSTLDEAVMTLATTDPVEFQMDIAIKRKHAFHIRDAYIYHTGQDSPLISLLRYDEMMNPVQKSTRKNEIITYGINGDFSGVSKGVADILFSENVNRERGSTVLLSSYDRERDRMSLSEFAGRAEATKYLASVLRIDKHFDYVTVAFHTDRTGYPRGVNLTTKARHHDFVNALVQMLTHHFAPDGKIKPIDSSIEDDFHCISRASNGKPVVDLAGSPNKVDGTGSLRLHFEDKAFMSKSFTDYPALTTLAKMESGHIPLAHSFSGHYWDNQALVNTMKFLRSQNKEIARGKKQKTRPSMPGKKRGLSK